MGLEGALHQSGQHIPLLPALTITTAVTAITTTPVLLLSGMVYLVAPAVFVYGSGGTSADAYVQTSFDGGTTWVDVINFHFLTTTATKISAVTAFIAPASQAFAPGDAALTANTIIQGALGDRVRLKYTTVGTYGGSTTLQVDAIAKG